MRAQIRTLLEEARGEFTDLVGSLSNADLRLKAPDSGWTVGEVAVHVVWSLEHTPALIHALRRNKDYLNSPLPVTERIKRLNTWWTARRVTPQALVRRFEAAFPSVLALVNTIQSDEWERSGRAYGEGSWTVGNALRHQGEHVEEHIQQIRRLLRQD